MKKVTSITGLATLGVSSLLLLPSQVLAAATTSNCLGIEESLPFLTGVCTAGTKLGNNPAAAVNVFVQSAITLLFIAVFVIAVVYTFLAAIKYIRSEGNEQKVEEAKNAVKAVLLGVAAMFIALVGIVAIGAIFGGTNGGVTEAIDNILKQLGKQAS